MSAMPGTWDGLDAWFGIIIWGFVSIFLVRACLPRPRPTGVGTALAPRALVSGRVPVGLWILWGLIALAVVYFAALGTVRWWLAGIAALSSIWLASMSAYYMLAESAVTGRTANAVARDLMIPGAGGGALLLLIGVGGYSSFIGAGTPAPRGIGDPLDPASFPAVLAYARSLAFDDRHRSMDEKWLTAFDASKKRVSGPKGSVMPEKHSFRNGIGALAGIGNGRGRIVARMVLDSAYVKLHLPADTSWMWVDDLQMSPTPRGDTVATFRMLIVSANGVIEPPTRNNKPWRGFVRSTGVWANHAIAKWTFDPADECDCADCLPHGYQCVWC